MAQSYRNRFLSAQRQSEAALKALYAQLADAIGAELTRRADADGNIPRSATFDIQQAAGDLVRRLFLGRNRNGEWAPFDTLPNGTIIPLSPYMRQLWESIKTVVRIPVEQNAAILARRLPADVAYVMQRATLNPFVVAKGKVSEQVFRPNPLAAYEAPHTWADPNGYRLSDRVWNAATLTRRQIDAFMEEGIREGKGALQMSRELRQFLTPGESLRKTNKPYGTSASFSGMRLARTEISQAHQRASVVSAAMNPFVSGMKWNLSASHPKIDVCDDLARGGPNGDGVYSIEAYPPRPHPQCVTPGQMVTTDRGDIPIEDVQVGDMVLTHKGRYQPVLAVWATPLDGPVYRFETEQGSFELTGNHPVLLRSGWVNAERLQPSDEILHAGVGAGFDLGFRKSDDMPPLLSQEGIALDIAVGSVSMPSAVALDADANGRQSYIDKIKTHLHFLFVKNADGVEGHVHGDLQGARVCEANFPVAQEHRHEAGIALLLGLRNFTCYIWSLCVVFVARSAKWTLGIVGDSNSARLGLTAHLKSMLFQQSHEGMVGDLVVDTNVGGRTLSLHVDRIKEAGNALPKLFFDSQGVELGACQAVLCQVGSTGALHALPADGTRNHYSLLSLPPDERWGARSGNPGVRGVANPSQAPLDYITILAVSTCQYTGKVYNMTVADDHSYTVNGAVVHNCLCYSTNVIIEDPDAVLEQLRADIQAAKQEFVNLVGPVEVDRFTKLLLGQGLEEVRVLPGATRVIAPPPVIVPPAVPPPTPPTPPPVVVQPVVPAFDPDDPVQVRQRILEIGRATRRRSDEIEEQIVETAQELAAIERRMKNLAGRDLEAARQEYTAKSAAMTRLQAEQNQLSADLQRQYRDLTSVRDPAQVRIPANSPANWQEGVADFNRLVSRSVIADTDPTFVQMAPGGRGYYDALRRRINVTVDDKARIITHELGHWLEETNPDILRQALAFHARRTVGYNEEWLGPGYPVTETTKKDKFLHEYMGKTYGRDATEIVSMGIEWMHLRPAELAARDPDMFDFIFRLARGL